MKLRKGDKLYPSPFVRSRIPWWNLEVCIVEMNHEGLLGITAIDGDFYEESRMKRSGYTDPKSRMYFKHVPRTRILENE